ncbi:hypothetical protein [Prescottella agglutinans]|uniref:Uncharacterized protein n=1 Tax=Prescottella agglutinans TaxID=1644129 RepID=A0ABT6M5D3_9NOCA|nr:hypothetical protein [Prescottella agglutinans]MDH6279512.1 hypothetical protein [Prescottella agglutinans]
MSKQNPIVGYIVLAKQQREDGSDNYQSVGAVWPDRKHVETTRAELIAEAKRDGRDTEYLIGEVRSSA